MGSRSRVLGIGVVALILFAGCYYIVDEPTGRSFRQNNGGGVASAGAPDGGPSAPSSTDGDGGTETAGAPAEGPLAAEAQRLHGWLVRRGFERVGIPQGGTLEAGGHHRYEVEVLSGLCYVVLALAGEEGADPGLTFSDPQGVERARDARSDRRAALRYCAPASGPHGVEVRLEEGEGPWVSAVYRAPAGDTSPLARLFDSDGGDPPAPAPAAASPAPAGAEQESWQRVAAVIAELRGLGFRPVGPPTAFPLVEGGRVRRAMPLSEGSCYVLVVAAGQGVHDADAFLYDGAGLRAAFDAGGDRDAQIRYCPSASGLYQAEVRAQRGSGRLVAALLQGPTQSGEGGFVADSASLGLAANYAAMDRELQGRGYDGLGTASRGVLDAGGTASHELEVEAGQCYAVAAVGSEAVTDLDIRLFDGDGDEVDRDEADGRTPLARACPEGAGRYRVEVQLSTGGGAYMYRPYRFTRGTRGAFGLTGVLYLRAMEMVAVLDGEGYEPAAPPERRARQTLAASGRRTHRVRLDRGSCYAISAVGAQGLHDLDLELAPPRGAAVSTERGPNPLPVVRHCPTTSGRYRLTVSARAGAGRYVYQLFRRDAPAEGEDTAD